MTINGPGKLVPTDYRVEIAGKKYPPHAIGFGRPNGVYSSVEYFVGPLVDLIPAAADQILHDGERVQKCELEHLMLFLVYDVPNSTNPVLRHGKKEFSLNPDFAALVADLSGNGGTLTAQNQLNLTNPNAASDDYAVALIDTTRTRLELDSTPVDVVVVTLAFTAKEKVTIEIKKSDLMLGGSRKGRVYFHFTNNVGELMEGSSYVEGETYEGRELIGLDSGGFRVPLSPGSPTQATMIFRDEKIAGDLDLRLSTTRSVRIPEPINPSGKFPPPVEKLPGMVAWAPIIGTPIDAGFATEDVSIALNFKKLSSPAASPPGDGLRHLVVTFRVDQSALFVPLDYRVAEPESNTVYRPIAAAFGDSPVFVKGLEYEKIALERGDADGPKQQGGRLSGWTFKAGTVQLLYEVAPAQEYIFIHGNTQFVIEL